MLLPFFCSRFILLLLPLSLWPSPFLSCSDLQPLVALFLAPPHLSHSPYFLFFHIFLSLITCILSSPLLFLFLSLSLPLLALLASLTYSFHLTSPLPVPPSYHPLHLPLFCFSVIVLRFSPLPLSLLTSLLTSYTCIFYFPCSFTFNLPSPVSLRAPVPFFRLFATFHSYISVASVQHVFLTPRHLGFSNIYTCVCVFY